ncbi:MAG: B12-binding domain-containing radical SAM protein [Bacteroidetes bacterium]|nr:B12-binding domain-containing radical SAM protein [Bacteroidota bacterium]
MAKVTFAALGTEQLGISMLSAIARGHGHQTGLAFSASLFHDRFNLELPWLSPYFDDTKEVLDAIRAQQPDVVAFSPLTSTYQWSLDIARQAKEIKSDIKTVFGGVHASAVPHLLLQRAEVDFVVVGEGDVAFPMILQGVQTGDYAQVIPNTRYKDLSGKVICGPQKGFIQDLDSLPFADKPLWEEHVRIGDLYLAMASRGCPYRCTFCFNNFFAKLPEEKSGKYVRLRSPEHMIAELKIAKQRYDIRIVDFQDDIFTTSKKWLQDFLALYRKEINRPFQILTHPRYMDDDIARWLSHAGCEWVQMGVQSMDEGFKKDTLLRYERSDDVSAAIDVMNKYNMRVKVDHMFGLPDEPISAQENARVLYSEHAAKRIQTFWTCYLPGTEMMNDALAKGRLTESQAAKINEGEDFYFFRNTENIKDEKLMELYKAYEVIFRIMPVLPERWRSRLQPRHILMIPSLFIRPISMLSDVITGFMLRNPEFRAYALHNIFHLKKFLLRKLGYRNVKATKARADVSFDAPVVHDAVSSVA